MKSVAVVVPLKEHKMSVILAKYLMESKVRLMVDVKPFLDTSRNFLLYRAIKEGADVVIMLDDDVVPKVKVSQIVEDELVEKYDVVCGIYWLRAFNSTSVAVSNELFGEQTWLPAPPTVPVEVTACGTGFLVFNGEFLRETLPKVRELGGWFRSVIEDWDSEKYMGEDVYFFKTFKPRAVANPRFTAWHHAYGIYYYNEYGVIEAPFSGWGEW